MTAATKNSFQEYDPRHRLTGAVVLILLAIILLPMLLSKKPDAETTEAEPVVMEITREGNKVFVSRISSHTEKDSSSPRQGAEQASSAGSASQESDTESSALFSPTKVPLGKPANKKANEKTAKSAKASTSAAKDSGKKQAAAKKDTASKKSKTSQATAKKSSATAPAGSWILQVGVFSKAENASKKVYELKKKGFSAKSSKVKTSKGTATKVWIGPFKDRKSVEKMQERLQHKTKQRGFVVKIKS